MHKYKTIPLNQISENNDCFVETSGVITYSTREHHNSIASKTGMVMNEGDPWWSWYKIKDEDGAEVSAFYPHISIFGLILHHIIRNGDHVKIRGYVSNDKLYIEKMCKQ